jgi:hypothetical protein
MPGAAGGPLQLPQRPIPPVHHVWVASAGDGRRLYRNAFLHTFGVWRLGIYLAALASVSVIAVIDWFHLRRCRSCNSVRAKPTARVTNTPAMPHRT